MRSSWRMLALVGAVLAGCGDAVGEREDAALVPAEASARVSELLYRHNLVADPEVNAKMNEYVLAVSRDGVSVDSVMPAFHRWLVAWLRDHPGRAEAARLVPVREPR